ncbi:Predicted amino acid racemase [Clostridium collagenovorans DSM 3089]|uniref:Predicted amino acid racemase n=1 Tax=Clostridium collagenovorans DSM 3089 TaxID=1121306 RepID=A0A1M5TTZ8_9CLOT|nr:ornithine racemase Orr [Clostridium collagenovorans]SHH54148.1 Predicted amino acid racemase [Clostridium collagenovorans DSM 3089]
MGNPFVKVNLKKLGHNIKVVNELCNKMGIEIFGVTKVFCARKEICSVMIENGINTLADSRIKNLEKIRDLNCKRVLLRIPCLSEAKEVVLNCDISLNSEIETIKALDNEAKKENIVHNIILMIDLGDLREGILPEDILTVVEEVLKLKNINLKGIGTNLTCYGGIIPDNENLSKLTEIKSELEEKFKITLSIVSGGNSSSLYKVFDNSMIKGINNLRLGESLLLGKETAFGEDIKGCFTDVFTLNAEVIELKSKSSMPKGKIGRDAFGNIPCFEDKGIMNRAIVNLGKQDVRVEGISPKDKDIEVLGASSDHLILNLSKSNKNYKLGDTIEFNMDYGALLQSMTSEYIDIKYVVE